MHKYSSLLLSLFFLFSFHARSQEDDLMKLLEDDEPKTEYAFATFKSSRVVIGQSIEAPATGNLLFLVSHHFGRLNQGWYEYWGLDQAAIRFGFEYGISDWLAVGFGRSTYEKTYDGFAKVRILRQSKGAKTMPFTLSYFTNIGINTLKWEDPDRNNYFSSRLSFTHQILIARKFHDYVSVQVMPALVHRNLVPTKEDQNDVFSIGIGGRVKITQRISVNGEYHYVLPGKTADDYYNSLSLGVDIETGGHVFQLYFTNSRGQIEQQFIAGTTGSWGKGDIHFGFNIHRTFVLKRKKEFRGE